MAPKKTAKGKRAEQAALKKQQQEDMEKLQVKQAIQLQQRYCQAQILSELTAYFESHPSEASFMLASIKAGRMDPKP